MRFVRTLLALEVDPAIPTAGTCLRRVPVVIELVLLHEALLRRVSFEQRAVDREVIAAHQPLGTEELDVPLEEQLREGLKASDSRARENVE